MYWYIPYIKTQKKKKKIETQIEKHFSSFTILIISYFILTISYLGIQCNKALAIKVIISGAGSLEKLCQQLGLKTLKNVSIKNFITSMKLQ